MDTNDLQLTETVAVAAPPEVVYDLVADITRMGEWSPACTGGRWADDVRSAFFGTNKRDDFEYETHCVVEVANRPRQFLFVNRGMDGTEDLARWGYEIVPTGDGCEVTESWAALPAIVAKIEAGMDADAAAEMLGGMKANTQANMATTLANLKAAAES